MPGSIQIAGDRLIYDAIHHNGIELHDPNITLPKISRDIAAHSDALQQYSSIHPKKLIVLFVNEGHDIHHARLMLPCLQEIFPDFQIFFLFSAITTGELGVPYRCLPLCLIDHRHWFSNLRHSKLNWQNTVMDRKFLCLNRRPSLVRERLVHGLIQNLKPNSARLSLGCNNEHYRGPSIWIKNSITVDGMVSDQDKCQVTDPRFLSCLFNIVSESSDQSDPNVWKSLFITEKTWKPFGMYQIPLWMAVPGMVQAVRDLGFDVFDDLCDSHVYDEINDEQQRQDKLIQIVTELDKKYSILCCRRLRKQHQHRLEHNYRLLDDLRRKQGRDFLDAINSF